MSINALHVVSRISEEASGPTYSVIQLCNALREHDCDTTLAVLDADHRASIPKFVKSFSSQGLPASLGISPDMRDWLRQEATSKSVDIMHNHGLWMMPNIYAGKAVSGTNIPLIVSPRGTLSPWALNRSRWIKRAFWLAGQSNTIKHAAGFHATAEHEYQDIRRTGFKQPVCVIPNGVCIPELKIVPVASNGRRRLLFLGRIHPVKGIDILLHAWAAVSTKFPEWDLEIVGPDSDEYLLELQKLAYSLKLEHVIFSGPLYGQEKICKFQNADLYVLPSHSENFGMTVAESMAAGTPVITTTNTPWIDLNRRGTGWCVDIGVDSLVSCMEEALSLSPPQLAVMGERGREWMKDEYSWDNVAKRMKLSYQWIMNGGIKPDWIRT